MTSFRLTRRDVEHKVRPHDSGPNPRVRIISTVLARGVAHPAHIQMILWHLNFAAHCDRLALIDAMRQRIFDEDLR